jgi:tRNA(Ile)-lysidine synthase
MPGATELGANPLGLEEFAALMAPLGPFESRPVLAVAVSGGADSTALALLADIWARVRDGEARALIVDHGLRPGSAAEANLTCERLRRRGIAARVLPLAGLVRGPRLAARARAARYAALESACASGGVLHLLLGHHAGDLAETVAMRLLAGSDAAGVAAMPALAESAHVRLLRPLLAVPSGRLRATLRAAGEEWVEDPSNADPTSQRARLRTLRRDRDGIGPAARGAVAAAAARGRARAMQERRTAALLARAACIAPEGFAVLRPGGLPPDALAALLRTLAGQAWAPAQAQVRALARGLRPATLGGARLLPAGRRCPGGWLLVREGAAVAPPCAAVGGNWDGRFRLEWDGFPPADAEIGALADDAGRLRGRSDLPAAVLQTMPAVRSRGKLVVAPHIGYAENWGATLRRAVFVPAMALAGAPFLPAAAGGALRAALQAGYKHGDAPMRRTPYLDSSASSLRRRSI